MQLTVERLSPTKSGKGYMVKGSGLVDSYYSKAMGIEQTLGKTLDAVIGSFSTPAGVKVETIESFTISSAQSSPQPSQNGTRASISGDRWYMPFVSNVCAHAITSGLVVSPADLSVWARAAKIAALSADSMPGSDDDPTPF